MRQITTTFQDLAKKIGEAHVQHNERQQLKIQEDPWDNYLYYDSKYLLPLLCHKEAIPIEQQVLLAFFV
jgi:hypothetical protein